MQTSRGDELGRGAGSVLPRFAAAMLLLLLACCACGCADDSLVLSPNHEAIDPGTATRRVVHVNGRAVECWVARSPGARRDGPRAFVMLFPGKGDRADRWTAAVARSWGDLPVEMWGLNYPGSGGSDGPVRLRLVVPDAQAVFDAMHKTAPGRPVFLYAGSFGTAVALGLAARRPVAGLILQNPVPLRQLIMGRYGWWNLWLLASPVAASIPPDLDSIANAHRVTAPAVFLLADRDEVIPPRYHQMVVDAYAGPKRVIPLPGARHNDPLTREAAEALARDRTWLWQKAGNRGPRSGRLNLIWTSSRPRHGGKGNATGPCQWLPIFTL